MSDPKTPQKKTRLQAFYEHPEKIQRMREILADPVMVEAIAILEESTEPHDSLLAGFVREYRAEAPMMISLVHSAQAGQRRVLRTLRALAYPAPAQEVSILSQPLYGHIDESYFDQQNQ